jgi:hypothetical protein
VLHREHSREAKLEQANKKYNQTAIISRQNYKQLNSFICSWKLSNAAGGKYLDGPKTFTKSNPIHPIFFIAALEFSL